MDTQLAYIDVLSQLCLMQCQANVKAMRGLNIDDDIKAIAEMQKLADELKLSTIV